MMLRRMLLSILVLFSASSIALAQNKKNNALEQLKDVNRSSQSAAGTKNPEASKAKSNQNIDTPRPPAVRAAPASNKSKAERDAAAIKAYTSKPLTGQPEAARIQRKKIEVPSPVKAAAPVKPAPAKIATPVKPAPAKVAAPVKPAPKPVAATPARPSTSTFTTSSSSGTAKTSPSNTTAPAKKK